MFDFAAVAALLILSQPITKMAAIKPLVLLGQSSLQVFCVHLLFCFAGLTLMGNASIARMLPDPGMREKVLGNARDFFLRSF